MDLYEFTGTAPERGYQHGLALAAQIRASVRIICVQHAHHADRKRQLQVIEDVVEAHRLVWPTYVDELHAIAHGAGLPFEDVACWALRVYHRFNPARPEAQEELTLDGIRPTHQCFIAGIGQTAHGPMLGSALEDSPFFYDVHRVTPRDGYRFVAAVWAGTAWCACAMNEHGLAVAGASAEAGRVLPGMPGFQPRGRRLVPITYHLLLHCRDVEEALRYLVDKEVAGNFGLADRSGRSVIVEAVPGMKAHRGPESNLLLAGGNFRAPEMLRAMREAGVAKCDHFTGSDERDAQFPVLLTRALELHGPGQEAMEWFLRRHEGDYPPCGKNNVCSSIAIPRQGRLLLARRFPCVSAFEEIRV